MSRPHGRDDLRPASGGVLVIGDGAQSDAAASLLGDGGWHVTRRGLAEAPSASCPVDVVTYEADALDGHTLDAIRALTDESGTGWAPVVVIATGDASAIAATIAAGAHDVVRWPCGPGEWIARCRAALRVSREHQRLVEVERELRLLAEHATDLVIRCGLDGIVRYASPSALELLGWRPDELIGTRADALCHPHDVPAASVSSDVMAGKVVDDTRRIRRADGTWAWMEVRSKVVPAAEPGTLEIRAAGRDVTDRVAATAAMAASEARYRHLVDHLPDCAVFVLDRDLRVVMCGGENLTGHGYDPTALAGRPFDELQSATDIAFLRPHFERGLDGVASRFEYTHSSGRVHLVDVAPLAGAEGPTDSILVVAKDTTDRKLMERQLRHLADHDYLTDLLNRRGFEAALSRHAAHGARYGPAGALLLVDIDRFKGVNDTFGHHVGDHVIVAVANVLRGRLRTTDVLARLGGDEFALILDHVEEGDAREVAGALVRAVRAEPIVGPGGEQLSVTASIGVALFASDHTTDEVLRRADAALYAAKTSGRDQWASCDAEATTALPAASHESF